MATLRSLTALPRWLMLAALLCILAARVAVPSGWMPMVASDGGLVLAPCSGMGAVAMAGMSAHAMDHGNHDDHDGSQQHGDHPCSGAGVSAGLETPVVTAPLLFAPTHAVAVAATLSVSVGQGLAAPPPPSTGPPAFV